MYHRGLIALQGADANLQASQVTVRVAVEHRRRRHEPRHRVDAARRCRRASRPSRRTSSRSTWTRPRSTAGWTSCVRTTGTSSRPIPLPHKTDGYQRSGHGDDGGHRRPPTPTRTRTNTPLAVQLFSKAMGQAGGNNITAEFKNPGAPNCAALDHGDRRHVARSRPRTTPTRQQRASREITVPVKDIVVNLATDADRRARPARPRRSRPRSTPTRRASALVSGVPVRQQRAARASSRPRRRATTTSRPAPPARRRSRRPRCACRTTCAAARSTGPAAPPATPPTLVRTDARHITKGPFDMKVYRIGKDRSNNAVGVFLYCQQHAREWVTPITCLETAERLVRNYATDPTTKSYVDNLEHLHPAVGQPGRRPLRVPRQQRAAQEHEDLLRAGVTGGTTVGGIGNRAHLGRRPQPQQHGRHAVRRLRRRQHELHERRRSPARRRLPRPRSRTSTGSATRSRASSSPTTSTPTAATSCGRRARTSPAAA